MGSSWKFYHSLDKEVPVKFWKSSGSGVRIQIRTSNTDSGSGPDLPWRRSALSECSCFIL